LTSDLDKIQRWGLKPDSGLESNSDSEWLSDQGSAESGGAWSSGSDYLIGSEAESQKPPKEELTLEQLESRRFQNLGKLHNMEASVNLVLGWNPKRINSRKACRTAQWANKKGFPPGGYNIAANRDSYRYAYYVSGMFRAALEIVDALKFCKDTNGVYRNFLRRLLKSVPRKYFFHSEDCVHLRTQLFWALRVSKP